MMAQTPWQIGDVPGPTQASPLDPDNAAKLARKSKRPIIVVGGEGSKKSVVDCVIKISRLLGAPIVASPGVFKVYNEANGGGVFCLGIEDLTNRLMQPDWRGFDGNGGYGLAIFVGGIYYFQSMMLSGLKNFAPHTKTLSIDRFFHPNADFTLKNMSEEAWLNSLEVFIENLK